MIKNKFIRNAITKLHIQSHCKRATFLIEKKENTHLTFREWFEMQAHLAICPLCTLYKSQSIMLQQMIVKLLQKRKNISVSMSDEKKETLKKVIDDHFRK